MRVAALDLGTNTFLCLIAEVERGEITRVLRDEARTVRLGEGVDSKRALQPQALARADACLAEYEAMIAQSGVEKTLACATSAARDASNGGELLAIGQRRGIPIRIIGGDREAELTFWGTVGAHPAEAVAIIDVGGGSTELIYGGPGGLTSQVSVDVGSVRLTERALPEHPIAPARLQAARAWAKERFDSPAVRPFLRPSSRAIAVAGTATTLAATDLGRAFDATAVDGHEISLERLKEWTSRLAAMPIERRQELGGMDAKRADVIVGGAICLALACETMGARSIVVSTKGLRYGVAMKHEEIA